MMDVKADKLILKASQRTVHPESLLTKTIDKIINTKIIQSLKPVCIQVTNNQYEVKSPQISF